MLHESPFVHTETHSYDSMCRVLTLGKELAWRFPCCRKPLQGRLHSLPLCHFPAWYCKFQQGGVLCASPCTFPKRTIPILIKALKREGSNTLCSSLLLSIYMSYMLSMYLNMFKSLPPTLNTNQPTKKSHHLVNTAETWQEVSNYNCVCTGHLTVHFNSLQIKGKKIMLLTCSFQAVKVKSIHHLEQTVCYPTPH